MRTEYHTRPDLLAYTVMNASRLKQAVGIGAGMESEDETPEEANKALFDRLANSLSTKLLSRSRRS
jgi:hypothetical protein